jgi:hypothetical protein
MSIGQALTDADRAVGLTRGIATLIPDDLSTGNLGLELGLSLWMQRADLPLSDACAILLTVRDALVETSDLDPVHEPIPLLAGDDRTATLGLAIYLHDLVNRAASHTGRSRHAVAEAAIELLRS